MIMFSQPKPDMMSLFMDPAQMISCVVPDEIGGPPYSSGGNVVDSINLLKKGRLMIDIEPCKPNMEQGLTLFRLEPCWLEYVTKLAECGYFPGGMQMIRQCITLACQAESFPSETFQNDYGEHFLSQIADVGASALGQIAQISGSDSLTQTGQVVGGKIAEAGKGMDGAMSSMLQSLGSGLSNVSGATRNKINQLKQQKGVAGEIGGIMDRLLAGARIDFPMLWKNSSYSPTFSCSVRLYNPNPASNHDTEKYIVAPLAAILTLALPRSADDFSYQWPFFCKVNCKGLFKIHAGAITNITVTKGGDQGSVHLNQRVGIVDVRIDFINLHNTILLSKQGAEVRPTLKGYLDNMLDRKWAMQLPEMSSMGSTMSTEVDFSSPPIPRIPTASVSSATSLLSMANSMGSGGLFNT